MGTTDKTGPILFSYAVVAEGMASKPIGSTKSSNATILEEGTTMVSRMQKLAGIKSK